MSNFGFATRAVHAGQEADGVTGAVIPSISVSTTFKQNAPGEPIGPYDYSRSGNPTRIAFEQAVASLEGAKHGLAFSSGSAAIATIVNMFSPGDHLISVNDVYGGTNRYFTRVAKPHGIETTFVDITEASALPASVRPNTKVVWIETPTNPTLRVIDIAAVAALVREHAPQAILVIDNTFLSPYFQNPLKLGADIVLHSVTKYLNGHSDAVMGALAMNDDALFQKLKFLQNAIGAVPSAFDCFLANRGLKTLHVRMEQHQKNAIAVANFLAASPLVDEVIYPGLASHPQHEIAARQQSGFGGMVSFRIKGDLATATRFFQHTRIFALAESLGGVESLAELPSVMTHAALTPEERATLGITDTLIRLSCGIEDAVDLVEDLRHALEAAQQA
ncbi:cystathionine gamma-lyase [Fonticula alba]|uniref:cystathionine gamma-lyase n=1 Tax=Fonticula alba TaxID=691883 RepID=A0A058ZD51_FONAL|nr:cystathionine gamma-lyase [Fonticula alba]KCV71367.1 cystathionine gamma-lyase [Fonticula alba]|eukprot:XP_009494490.1 cystathionine gamma-lyase [Fonticula alba]